MQVRRLVLIWLLVLAAPVLAGVLAVATPEGARRLDRERLEGLAGGPQTLQVHEPHENVERGYVGVAAEALLQALYGDAWRDAGAVLFECADGYRALIEPAKLARHRALLAWARADGAPFALRNRLQGDEAVDLGPFYLVWDNREDDALRAQGASDWPYQVVGVALVDAREHLAKAWPPTEADARAQRGFAAFRRHCITCHAINGQGGGKAPELNYPVSVTEYLAEGWLRRWMLEPAAIRLGTTMPGLPANLPDREAVAADIEAYLKAMSDHKQAP